MLPFIKQKFASLLHYLTARGSHASELYVCQTFDCFATHQVVRVPTFTMIMAKEIVCVVVRFERQVLACRQDKTMFTI